MNRALYGIFMGIMCVAAVGLVAETALRIVDDVEYRRRRERVRAKLIARGIDPDMPCGCLGGVEGEPETPALEAPGDGDADAAPQVAAPGRKRRPVVVS